MRHTFYGNLAGSFEASGFGLFVRGVPMWLMVFAPLALAVDGFTGEVDWKALAETLAQGGDDVMSRIEGSNPGLGSAIVFAMLMCGASITLAALLYPAFQAVVIRWWSSGLRFGDIEVRSQLRIRNVYAAYARFVGYAVLFSIAMGIGGAIILTIVGALTGAGKTTAGEIIATLILLAGYVVAALGFSTIYRATVLLSLWQLGMESLNVVRPFIAGEGQGNRPTQLRDRGRSCRCAQCGRLLMNAPITSGAGIYFDGATSARHEVLVTLAAGTLRISDRNGQPLAEWPYGEIEQLAAPDKILRLGRLHSTALERLEIADVAFAAEIDTRSAYVDRTGALQRRERISVIAWSVGATLSLVLVAFFGVPAIAARLTPLLPAVGRTQAWGRRRYADSRHARRA